MIITVNVPTITKAHKETTTISARYMAPHASLRTGLTSQKKCLIVLGPQRGKLNTKELMVSDMRKPVTQEIVTS